MGNCQAIDNATLVIQHPSGRTDKFYWPITASEVMKSNPGHFVALFLTTTTFRPSHATTAAAKPISEHNGNNLVRVTRIKLLRPTDMLILGQVYRLVTNQEVMKGLSSKKYAKMKKNQNEPIDKQERLKQKLVTDLDSAPINSEMEKNKQAQEKHRSRTTKSANSAASKSRQWQPSLNSISESTS